MSVNELNNYLYSYEKALPQGDKYKYHLANSIWFKDDDKLKVNEDFLILNSKLKSEHFSAAKIMLESKVR